MVDSSNYVPAWARRANIYHIYPLGFFGAPHFGREEDGIHPRLAGLREYYEHIQGLGFNCVQFGPVFESTSHGYDTIDYLQIDHRLGTNDLFKQIVAELHERGIRVIVDGVFNHVSREFASFKDIQQYREKSWRKHWHYVDFSRDSPRHDGFDYQNWEGHYDLVKLNLGERDVREHLFDVSRYWLGEVGIDGWRLDVAYLLPPDFIREFRTACKAAKPDCFLVGEMIHGPYTKWVGPGLLDAGTGYQVHKSIWSAFNSTNMYELKAVLEQSFHPDFGWVKNALLMNFLGNHDTDRIASQLGDPGHLFPAFLILYCLNGVPKVYYGDEVGLEGRKVQGSDAPVRQPMPPPDPAHWPKIGSDLATHIHKMGEIRQGSHALTYGNLISLWADNTGLAFLRRSAEETIIIVVNAANEMRSMDIPLWMAFNTRGYISWVSGSL